MTSEISSTSSHADASAILQELDSTAELALHALDKATLSEQQASETEEDREARQAARIKMYSQRASRQRNLGREEMARVYAGTMVITQPLKVFDQHLASSVVRFLALTDRTLYLLGRIGVQYMSPAQMEKVQNSIHEKIDAYVNEGRMTFSAASEFDRQGREKSLKWWEPNYAAPALDAEFQYKTREVLRLAEAVKKWDEAIKLMCQCEFNEVVTLSQVSEVRLRERRLFSDINRFCATLVIGMRNRTLEKIEVPQKQSDVPLSKIAEPNEEGGTVQ